MNARWIRGCGWVAMLMAMVCGFAMAADPSTGPGRGKPNIVLLFVDDFGWAEVVHRRDKLEMPAIDALMEDGLTFTDAYAASPCCSPSRASVITGQHPARLKMVRHVPGFKDGEDIPEFHTYPQDPANMPSRNWLPKGVPTIAQAVKPHGYHSVFIGKWHLGHEPYFPIHHGFDEQLGVTGYGHPKSYYPPYFGKGDSVYQDAPDDKYLTDRITDDAVEFIGRAGDKSPFLLTVFYYGVHGPFIGRKDLVEKFKARGLSGRELHQAAMIGAVDESLARIRAALGKAGIADNTAILFLGDQGSLFDNSPLRGGKPAGLACFEGGARIPFVVHWPGVTRAGGKVAEPVLTTDVLPTLAAMAGGEAKNSDGLSLVPLLKGEAEELPRDEIHLYRSYDDQYAVVRAGKWKLIAYRSGKDHLYDLKADPSELRNLVKANPEIYQELSTKLGAWEKEMGVAR